VQTGGFESQGEFDFSTEKINENFSNYSAYHHRSVYIRKTGILATDIVEAEFSMIENAIYTEPDDQSSWWYHQFLLTWMSEQKDNDRGVHHAGTNKDDGIKWYISIVEKQIEVMRGLLSVETSSKWAMSSLCLMLDILLKLSNVEPKGAIASSSHHFSVNDLINERQALLSKLCLVDPYHVNRYSYMKGR
jgi:geranylgeranyl transferase type-2 subunit alpha